jgi:hypothetical protein
MFRSSSTSAIVAISDGSLMSGCPFLLRARGYCGTNWVQIVAQNSAHVTEASPRVVWPLVRGLDGGYMPVPWADHDFSCHINDLNEFQNLKSINDLILLIFSGFDDPGLLEVPPGSDRDKRRHRRRKGPRCKNADYETVPAGSTDPA